MQGMIPFLEVTRDIGGLQLVPRSHREEVQEQIREENFNKELREGSLNYIASYSVYDI